MDTLQWNQTEKTCNLFPQKRVIANRRSDQYFLLKNLWFKLYSRGDRILGSCGFEHVFLHETLNGDILGLHNWIYFHDQQQKNHKLQLNKLKKQLNFGNVWYSNWLHFNVTISWSFFLVLLIFRKRTWWSLASHTIISLNQPVQCLSELRPNWMSLCTLCALHWKLRIVQFHWMDRSSLFEPTHSIAEIM